MISNFTFLRIGRILGLDNSPSTRKIFEIYGKFRMRSYHGIVEKEILGSRILLNLDDPMACEKLFFLRYSKFYPS